MPPSMLARAAALGPAATAVLDPGPTLRVHGVFASTVNLRADETGDLVSLVGPAGAILPHAVALARDEDFPAWGLVPGAPVACDPASLTLPGAGGPIRVDLRSARRLPARPLPPLVRPGAAHAACRRRLEGIQAAAGAELRLSALEGAASPSPLGEALAGAARALAAAGPAGPAPLAGAVAALVGLGPGLTPSGDDYLCGWLAAARAAARPALAAALAQAIGAALPRTSVVSAFLLTCALRGLWVAPLVDLAEALAAEREAEALAALEALCTLGHSSGADLATGFLFGVGVMGSP